MKVTICRIGFFLFSFFGVTSWVLAEVDTGTGHNFIFKKKLSEEWFLSSRNFLATRDHGDELFFIYLDGNIGRELGKAWGGEWEAELGYRHAWLKIGDSWREEYRPSAILSYGTEWDGWSINNKHRLEYRRFESNGSPDRFRYRNETRLVAPYEFTSLRAKWFLEEEIFYELTDDGFNTNWLTTGFRWKLKKGLVAKIGYRWQAQKFGDEWSHRHQLVTGLLFFF